MMLEIEMKLKLPERHAQDLIALLSKKAEPLKKHTFSAYYDTNQHTLKQAGYALRLRQVDDQVMQTLKNAGSAENGLHQRQEWEWLLKGKGLDYTRLAEHLPEIYEEINQRLTPIFNTEFMRHVWMHEEPDGLIEIAFDHGLIESQHHVLPICELELELKKGDVAVLYRLSEVLQSQLPLEPFNKSKAERGYALHAKQQSE